MYRLYDTSEAARKVHAEGTKQLQVQNMENSHVDAVRVFYHDSYRSKYSITHDEGKPTLNFYHLIYIDQLILQNYKIYTKLILIFSINFTSLVQLMRKHFKFKIKQF